MTHPSIKKVSWVPYNEHDELKRAMAEIERLTAVVDAAVVYVQALESHGAGVPDRGATKKYLKNLLEEVAAFEEHDL